MEKWGLTEQKSTQLVLKKLYRMCLERKTVEKNKKLKERNRKMNLLFKSTIAVDNVEQVFFYATILSERKNFSESLTLRWGRKVFMECVFDFLCSFSENDRAKLEVKKKEIAISIYDYFYKDQKRTYFWKYRTVMKEFENFFLKNQNKKVYSKLRKAYGVIGDESSIKRIDKQFEDLLRTDTLEFLGFCYENCFESYIKELFNVKIK